RVHWDEDLAQRIGMPGPYDYGPQRIAWLGHLVTDWMGDDAWLHRLTVKLVAPNFVGDVTWLTGQVTDVGTAGPDLPWHEDALGVVTLALQATDQRGRRTAEGTAEVVLLREHAT